MASSWQIIDLAAGTSLWRHHSDRFAADHLRQAHLDPTGRFDCPDSDGWASSYFSFTTQGTFGETLLRDVGPGAIVIAGHRLAGTVVSRVVTARDVKLVDLRGPAGWAPLDNRIELVGFPTPSDPHLYQRSRDAAAAIRMGQPNSDGLCWLSARNPMQTSVLIWADTPDAPLVIAETTTITAVELPAVASMLTAWTAVLMESDELVVPDDVQAGMLGWTR